MLALAEGDLDLRNQVDVRRSICDEVMVGDQLEHWTPHAAEAAIGAKRFAAGKTNEPGARRQITVGALLESALPLQEGAAGKQLSERHVGFEDRGPSAQPFIAVSSRQGEDAERADDRSAARIRKQDVLEAEFRVADTALRRP